MIAEDEFLIALLVEEDLRNSGYTVVGPFTTIAEAKEAAAREQIDAAVLDINMQGQLAYCVADELIARHVPFLFLSGYGQSALPVLYASRPRMTIRRLIPAKR
jgi:DNA-binding response OmpR family regulator